MIWTSASPLSAASAPGSSVEGPVEASTGRCSKVLLLLTKCAD